MTRFIRTCTYTYTYSKYKKNKRDFRKTSYCFNEFFSLCIYINTSDISTNYASD